MIKPYLIQIFLAVVLFFTGKPLYRRLAWLFRGQRALAAFCTCALLALLITLPLFALVNIIAKQALELYGAVSAGLKGDLIWPQISGKFDLLRAYPEHFGLPLPEQANLEQVVQTILSRVSQFIYTNTIALVRGFTSYLLNLLLILFIAFFMFLQGDRFIEEIKKLSPLDEAHNQEILQVTERTIKATLWSTLIVALVQGILGGAGFFFFRGPDPVFWGAMMTVASILPVVGPGFSPFSCPFFAFTREHFWQCSPTKLFPPVPQKFRTSRSSPSLLEAFLPLNNVCFDQGTEKIVVYTLCRIPSLPEKKRT